MSASYARQHQQKKLQFSQGATSSSRQRLTSEERRNMLGNKDSYIEYLESQLDRVCELSLVENPQITRRLEELETLSTQHEEKFANITKLIKLLQSFAETQEDENRLMKEQMNKPMQAMTKRMDGFSQNIINDLKDQITAFDEKSQIRDMQVQETFEQFQKNISSFEGRIESFANQLSIDMAADIKVLSNQIGAEPRVASAAAAGSPQNRLQPQVPSSTIKPEMDSFKSEINKKIELVMNEMRKNAMISDLENLEVKVKKEAKERTYLCKFVEELTRKIDEIPTNTGASTSRGLSPDMNSMKLLKQVETDIEDLKEVMNALVDKIEDIQNQESKTDTQTVTREEFERLERSILQRREESKEQDEDGDQFSEEQNLSRQTRQTLRSDAYLSQNLRSPQFDQGMLSEIPSMRSDQEGYSSRLNAAQEGDDDGQYREQDEDLRQTLLSKHNQNQRDALLYSSDPAQANLGESFGFNQHPSRFSSTPATFHPISEEERQQWLRYDQSQPSNAQRASSSGVKRGRKLHQEALAASPELGVAMSGNTLKKKKKSTKEKPSRSQSKSPRSSLNKLPQSSHSIEPKKSKNNIQSQKELSQARSPNQRRQSKEKLVQGTSSTADIRAGSQKRSPSPIGNSVTNKYAEKKKQNGEKIRELFKKKKESVSSISSSGTQISKQIEKEKKLPDKKKKL